MITLALRVFWREWRSGELRILIAALIIAVAALTTIGIYTDRMLRSVENQAAELLGGDLQLSSPSPISDNWQQQAQKNNLKTTILTLFSSMVVAKEQLQLADIKAVTENYPLRGEIRTGIDEIIIEKNIPAPGTVWVDARLLNLVNISLNTRIKIGRAEFVITKILNYEPDAQPYNLNIAPRVLMNAADLPATSIIQPGSRIEYRWLLTGTDKNISDFSAWLKPQLSKNQKLRNPAEALTELKSTLQKSNAYLHLAAIACMILAGIAIATAARRYSQRHYDISALLRCFGVTQKQILQFYLGYLFVLGLAASIIGVLIGFFAQALLTSFFSSWISITLPPPHFSTLLYSVGMGIVILFGFALPPLLSLKDISPLRVLRRESLTLPDYSIFSYLLAGLVIIGLLLLQIPNPLLILIFLSSLLFVSAALYAAALGLIYLTRQLRNSASAMHYGLANLSRRAHSNAVQLVAFGLVIMIVLSLTLIRNDVFNSWQQQLKPNAPNYFAINIQPHEVQNLNQLLAQNNISASEIYPMVRGRLISKNNIPILDAVPSSARNNNALHRELNLTWTNTLPVDNRITTGDWGKGISIEKKLANDLGIMIGDILTFQIGNQKIQDTVRSLRTLSWDSFHPNFFMIFPTGTLHNLPATYITSFYITPTQKPFLSTLVKLYPNITLIDIALILTQVREFTNKMALAIELILGFTLLAGLAVLYAALQTSRDERLLEGAILRTLGASSQLLKISLATEFMVLGFFAGLLGATGASLIAFVLSDQVFQMPYNWSVWPWIAGTIGGTVLVSFCGLYGTRDVLKQSPLIVLQEVS